MEKIEDNFNQDNNKHMNHTKEYSDNNSELNQFIFWRVEYNQDTKTEHKPFKKNITKSTTWSNYGNMGQLKVFEKK
jgi:hypothetical protein